MNATASAIAAGCSINSERQQWKPDGEPENAQQHELD
jgi:phage terminase small subunit